MGRLDIGRTLTEVETACIVAPMYIEEEDAIKDKINELITAHNKFVVLYSQHYHKHTDSYNSMFATMGPEELSERHHEG